MSKSRTQNFKKNFLFGLINRIITLLLPFVIRTVIIHKLGAEYLGLNSLFSSILQVLNMAELGFSSAITYHLYKPMADGNDAKICALLNFYRRVYKVIGGGILGVGMFIIPLVPKLVKGDWPPDINIYSLFIIYLLNTSISYLFFAYKSVILTVAQRQDIISNIDSVITIIRSAIQLLLLLCFSNYYCFVITNLFMTVIYNLYIAYITRKCYPQYRCYGEVESEDKLSISKLIKGSAIGKVAQVARNSFDSIVLSMYLGLVEVAIYSNYYYILSSVGGFLNILITSLTAGVGNSIAKESIEKNYSDFQKFNFYYIWLASWCTICMMCLYQPFMKLWTEDKLTAQFNTMIMFCIYFYIGQVGQVRAMYASAAGIWWDFKNLFIGEAIANLLLNFVLGFFWGMNGILMATNITVLFFSIIGIGRRTLRLYFKKSPREYFLQLLIYTSVMIAVAIVTYAICSNILSKGILGIIYRGVVCVILPNALFFILAFYNKKTRLYLYDIYKKLITNNEGDM